MLPSRLVIRFALSSLALVGQLITADGADLRLTDQSKITASTLVDISADWEFTFASPDGELAVDGKQLVFWGRYRDDDAGPQVVLVDGSVLVAEVIALSDESLEVYSDLFGDVTLPLEQAAGILFAPPFDPFERDRLLKRVRVASGTQDRLVLANGDVVRGLIQQKPAIGPRASDETLERIHLRLPLSDDPLAIRRDKMAAVIFDPALRKSIASRQMRCYFGMTDGSLLNVRSVANDRDLDLTLACGLRITTDLDTITDVTSFLQPVGGNSIYLSDIKPLNYKHIPFLDREWDYQVDANVLGGRLRSKGNLALKGIGMHSTARLAYVVPKDAKHLQAELALDDQSGDMGSVSFRIFANRGESGWQSLYRSKTIRGGDAPLDMSVNVKGARGILLVVDFADRGDVLDHANWLNVRFTR